MRQLQLATALCIALVASAIADLTTANAAITVSASNWGHYDSSGSALANNTNYLAGLAGENQIRDFFGFDLSSVSGTITGATLQAFNPGPPTFNDGYQSPDATETFGTFDVTTAFATLVNGTGGVGAYNDLGGGTSFGTVSVSSADNGTNTNGQFVSVALNSSAITAINNALGGNFAIGGAITTISGLSNQFIFGFTNDTNANVRLVLEQGTTTATTPEPASLALWGLGALGCAVAGYRRRKQAA
jgi:hypothetical protein